MIPTAQNKQKDCRAGKDWRRKTRIVQYCLEWTGCRTALTVVAPTPNTMKSVMDVTVMATPACFMVRPMADGASSEATSEGSKLSKHCIMTNMSSMPV